MVISCLVTDNAGQHTKSLFHGFLAAQSSDFSCSCAFYQRFAFFTFGAEGCKTVKL